MVMYSQRKEKYNPGWISTTQYKNSKPEGYLVIFPGLHFSLVWPWACAQGRYRSTVASRRVAIGVCFKSAHRTFPPVREVQRWVPFSGPGGMGYVACLCLASRRPGMIFHAEDDSLVFNSPPPVRNIIRSSLGCI